MAEDEPSAVSAAVESICDISWIHLFPSLAVQWMVFKEQEPDKNVDSLWTKEEEIPADLCKQISNAEMKECPVLAQPAIIRYRFLS